MRPLSNFIIITILALMLEACESVSEIQTQIPDSPKVLATPAVSLTEDPAYVTATVWEHDPSVPILVYHRFKTNRPSNLNIVSRVDFAEELEKLYQSGYVTISLERWLAGDIRVPEGKRPLILSMDDLFYRNQITLTPEGEPSPESGLGIAWAFYQTHPDFGFHWALFASLGDKPYGEGSQAEQDIQLAKVIVWCLEHDAMIYNHTFRHANLQITDGLGITAELRSNDNRLRALLTLINREDLIPKLRNMLALPGGRLPRLEESRNALYGYLDPEGEKIQAIFNIDFISRPDFLDPPYAKKFNPVDLPRMVANLDAIDYLIQHSTLSQKASSCKIGPISEDQSNPVHLGGDLPTPEIQSYTPAFLGEQILTAIKNSQCPPGVYATEYFVFFANREHADVIQIVNNVHK